MRFIIADTFQESLADLDAQGQTQVKLKAWDFQADPRNPGFRLHKLEPPASRDFWSISVNMDLRIIVYKDGDVTVLCYADHHDAAYSWAERHRFEISDVTGAAQVVTTERRVEEVVEVVRRREEHGPALFDRYPDDYLLAIGVPPQWLDAVKMADETMFLDHLLEELPAEVSERLMRLAAGQPVPRPVAEPRTNPFLHPDARSRFLIVGDDTRIMERALEEPWDKWLVFLHPSQREMVERTFDGPARVSGGAGTGKTVVALHRAGRLARENPESRILLTTYSRTLASRLRQHLERLLGSDAPDLTRIDVTHLHHFVAEMWREHMNADLSILDPDKALPDLLRAALTAAGGSDLSTDFLRREWEDVIDQEGITSWDEYKGFPRTGRGTPLGARQRLQAWQVFEKLHDLLERRGLRTWQRLCYETAFLVSRLEQPPYQHVVADEVQDFGPAELRLLAALAPSGRDALFLAGDLGQRIYKGNTSFLAAGIDVRGRSRILEVNYRTTEQIRRHADALLPSVIAGADGEDEPRRAISLLSGPEPEFAFKATVNEEIGAATAWLKRLLANGYRPEHVGIFVRTKKLMRDRVRQVVRQCGLEPYELKDDEPPQRKRVSIGTMHRAKGLEFRAVMVMACDDNHVPHAATYQRQPDSVAQRTFLEQEQNLLYVAATRARERLFISCAGQQSRFLRR